MSPEKSRTRRHAIEVVGREIEIQFVLDPSARTRGLTADAVGQIIEALGASEATDLALALSQLRECEEALRSEHVAFAEFREQMLAPIKSAEGKGIESMSWDDLLGVAVRNLNATLEAHDALRELVREARPWL